MLYESISGHSQSWTQALVVVAHRPKTAKTAAARSYPTISSVTESHFIVNRSDRWIRTWGGTWIEQHARKTAEALFQLNGSPFHIDLHYYDFEEPLEAYEFGDDTAPD